ncbi:hypothetical protein L2E82_34420 [Cichorium intybus]|uniref:Uncharacterized protein n=1 Tax=Cichorium intybus TaxID=13427 RepID=A0ACB9BM30_CICIN|nr:hypothetical protein L2E82_34420 [Cichorium intybus]
MQPTMWNLRVSKEVGDANEVYKGFENPFMMQINHGGFFSRVSYRNWYGGDDEGLPIEPIGGLFMDEESTHDEGFTYESANSPISEPHPSDRVVYVNSPLFDQV